MNNILSPRMIVGLGNSSLPYTRHSVGMSVLKALASSVGEGSSILKMSKGWEKSTKCKAIISTLKHMEESSKISQQEIKSLLVLPSYPMNASGTTVAITARHFKVPVKNIIVVHDDLETPMGKWAMVTGGGARGHNGIRSVVKTLGTTEFKRVRIGIGRPPQGQDVTSFVLSPFTREEETLLTHSVFKNLIEELSQVLQKEMDQ